MLILIRSSTTADILGKSVVLTEAGSDRRSRNEAQLGDVIGPSVPDSRRRVYKTPLYNNGTCSICIQRVSPDQLRFITPRAEHRQNQNLKISDSKARDA